MSGSIAFEGEARGCLGVVLLCTYLSFKMSLRQVFIVLFSFPLQFFFFFYNFKVTQDVSGNDVTFPNQQAKLCLHCLFVRFEVFLVFLGQGRGDEGRWLEVSYYVFNSIYVHSCPLISTSYNALKMRHSHTHPHMFSLILSLCCQRQLI